MVWSTQRKAALPVSEICCISIVDLRGTKNQNLPPAIASVMLQIATLFCTSVSASEWSPLKAHIAWEIHPSVPIYRTSNPVIRNSRIFFHKPEIWACDKHTWRQIKCLFGIRAALEKLPRIDALAIDWLSLRDQEFGLGEPEEFGFHLHPEELLGKEHSVESKGHRNSSKEQNQMRTGREKRELGE